MVLFLLLHFQRKKMSRREKLQKYQKDFENYSILFVDDDKDIRFQMQSILQIFFKETFFASNGLEAISLYKKHKPNFVLSDVTMPKCTGLEMAKILKELDSKLQIIFLTGHNEKEYENKIALYGGHHLIKPIHQDKLFAQLIQLLKE